MDTFSNKGWEHCNHYICRDFILTITSILTGIIGSLPWAKHKELWFPYMNVSSTVFPISESDQSIIAIRWAIWKCEKMSVLSWTQHRKQNSPNMHHNAFISSNIYIKVCYSSLFYLLLKMVLLLLQCIVEIEAKEKKKRKLSKKKFLFWKVYNWKQYILCTHYTK